MVHYQGGGGNHGQDVRWLPSHPRGGAAGSRVDPSVRIWVVLRPGAGIRESRGQGDERGLLFCDLNHIGVRGGVVGTRS